MKTPEHFDVEPLRVGTPDMRKALDEAGSRALAAVDRAGAALKAPAGVVAVARQLRARRRDS